MPHILTPLCGSIRVVARSPYLIRRARKAKEPVDYFTFGGEEEIVAEDAVSRDYLDGATFAGSRVKQGHVSSGRERSRLSRKPRNLGCRGLSTVP